MFRAKPRGTSKACSSPTRHRPGRSFDACVAGRGHDIGVLGFVSSYNVVDHSMPRLSWNSLRCEPAVKQGHDTTTARGTLLLRLDMKFAEIPLRGSCRSAKTEQWSVKAHNSPHRPTPKRSKAKNASCTTWAPRFAPDSCVKAVSAAISYPQLRCSWQQQTFCTSRLDARCSSLNRFGQPFFSLRL